MSEQQALLLETTERVLAATARDAPFAEAWPAIAEVQLDLLLMPEQDGGFGGDWEDFFAVARIVGAHATSLPIGEAILGRCLSGLGGFAPTAGTVLVAPQSAGEVDATGRFSGQVKTAPWGSDSGHVVADLAGRIARMRVSHAKRVERGVNPAGEARDTLVFDGAPIEQGEAPVSVWACGALLRTAQIAGALDAALALSIAYANERQQFGKPIGKFQAVQQSLAVFAEEAAAVNCGGQAAARAAMRGEAGFEIAAAKLRANAAAGVGAAVAHQVHGAIGFTQEHALHHFTRRLAAWRSEFGGDAHWAGVLGAAVCARGADVFWADLARRSDVECQALSADGRARID